MSALPMKHSIHTVGTINKNQRIWIANKDISKSFTIGDAVNISYDNEKHQITVNRAELLGNHSISSRNGHTPILDIKNSSVTKTFGKIEKVEVLYYEDKIVIRATKNEIAKEARRNKKTAKLFEIFCGGGTLTHFIKQSTGFSSGGGLEYNNKFLTVFEENNKEATLTIHSAIEDIHPSDLPTDIEILLCGIPCDVFTSSNLAMVQAEKNFLAGTASSDDLVRIEDKYRGEALTHFLLNCIQAMGVNCIVVEEVREFSKTSSSFLLRTVLSNMGYHLSERIVQGRSNKRQRWVLVAHMNRKIDLSSVEYTEDDKVAIETLLETPLKDRVWQTDTENKRVSGMKRKNLGVRAIYPNDTMTNVHTCHGTRHTECLLKKSREEELYSEFTNKEIAYMHGLKGFQLSGVKTTDRAILGQGVTDAFALIGEALVEER